MKKITILFPVSILSLVFGVSFVSASDVGLVATIQGSPMIFLSVGSSDKSGVYYDSNNIVTKEIASNGTSTNENKNGTSTNENKNGTSTNENKNGTSTDNNPHNASSSNFVVDGESERTQGTRGLAISEIAQVTSGQDLHTFVLSLVNKNKDITNVTTAEDRVSVTRNVPTKLFWFIPLTVKETASVISWGDGTNQVSVTRPWWNFFSKYETTTSSTTADIEFGIKNIPTGEFKAVLDATTKARIISEIEAAFRVNSSASSTTTN